MQNSWNNITVPDPNTDPDLMALTKKRPRRWPKVLLGLLLLAGAAAFVVKVYWPLHQAHSHLESLHKATEASLEEARQSFFAEQKKVEAITKERDEVRAKLEEEVKEKEEALKRLADVQKSLSDTLGAEIESGEVLVVRRNGQLVVDVSDKILFGTGDAEVSERGKKVLDQVAETLSRIDGFTFQIAGHTDSARVTTPSLVEKYPTNWELSTARATNVVRYLEDTGKVPGDKMMAAGFADHRPVAANTSRYGMQRNRRIDITLLPDKKVKE